MPILGVPASLGEPESCRSYFNSPLEASEVCASVNGNAMLGKAVRPRYCPATVSDVVFHIPQTTAARREGFGMSVAKSGDRSRCALYMFLFRGEGELR